MERLNWKEKFSAVLLLVTGILYLGVFALSLADISNSVRQDGERVSINTADLVTHLQSLLTIICAIGGGILIFRKKAAGWAMGLPVFLLILYICVWGFKEAISWGENLGAAAAVGGGAIFLLGLMFLILPGAIKRLQVEMNTFFGMLVIAGVLAALYLIK